VRWDALLSAVPELEVIMGCCPVDLGGERGGRAGHRVLSGRRNRGRMRSTLIPSASSAPPSWLARSLMLPISHSVAGSWSAS